MTEFLVVLWKRARSWLDQQRYTVVSEWPFAISLIGIAIGLGTIVPTQVGTPLSIVGVVLGLVVARRDFRNLRRRWRSYDFSKVVASFPRSEIPPPTSYVDGTYLSIDNRGTMLVSDVIDAAVRSGVFRLALLQEDYELPPRLREVAPFALRRLNRGKVVFNGELLGLADDPLPPTRDEDSLLLVQKARFFDSQCSNEICLLHATAQPSGRGVSFLRQELRGRDGHLLTLKESALANGIGVSTIALTTDGRLLLVPQKRGNNASEGLLAPSGSGALEPRDLPRPTADDGPTTSMELNTVIAAGMRRELLEETGLADEVVGPTVVTGFGRWMERGGRPEFFGYTTLRVSSRELAATRLSGGESIYSGRFEFHELDVAQLGHDRRWHDDPSGNPALPDRIRESGALPLLLCLRALARWQARESPAPGSAPNPSS